MKIQYQKGDFVFVRPGIIIPPGFDRALEVKGVRKMGLVVENWQGERHYFGKNQIEPAEGTLQKAEWIQPCS